MMYRLLASAIAFSSLTLAYIQEPLINHGANVQVTAEIPKVLVSSESLEGDITIKNLWKRAEKLYEIAQLSQDEYNHATRVIGSKGHLGTLDYIYESMGALDDYYTLSNQTFHAAVGRVYEYRVLVGDKAPGFAYPMSLTPPTTDSQPVRGNLTMVENEGCDASDYPTALKGNVALIKRGTCAFGTKSALAGKAGAIAALIWMPGENASGTLGEPDKDHVATLAIGREDAAEYISRLADGEVLDAFVYIDGFVVNTPTTNIIAQTKGGDQDNCVMLGGHSDGVTAGPGINDDGSGTLSILEVAKQLTKYELNNCVRFAWWAAEEEGLIGSDYYVAQLSEEENLKIRMFMDYDMMASPNYAYQVYDARDSVNPKGSQALRDMYTTWYSAHGLNFTYIPFDGRSDYDAFIKHGIPGGGIAAGAEGIKTLEEEEMFGGKAGEWYDNCYHQLCDDLDNLALDAWLINTKLIAHSVATYALSLEAFPKRTSVNAHIASAGHESPYHGPELVM